MEAEDHLRAALADQADSWEPPVESSLQRVHARERHRKLRWVLAAAVALIVSVAGAGTVVTMLRSQPVVVPATRSSEMAPSLQGTFEAQVSKPATLAGDWTLTLRPDGRLLVVPPAGYEGLTSGELYSAAGDEFRTTLFQTDVCSGIGVGAYTWVRTPRGVTFTAAGDECAARRDFFTKNSWLSTG